jgi:hypothetical protein
MRLISIFGSRFNVIWPSEEIEFDVPNILPQGLNIPVSFSGYALPEYSSHFLALVEEMVQGMSNFSRIRLI